MSKGHVRRQPQRTCISCQQTGAKRELVRIVRTPAGQVVVDPTGKLAGRGAYLCRNRRCWLEALAHKRIQHALKVELAADDEASLRTFMEQLPDEDAGG